jgi:para-nitrobenzyl esterase
MLQQTITKVRALVFATAMTLCGASATTAATDQTRPVVKTAEGPVTGIARNGVYQFLGIPYAAPPVGKWRWMPPQPVAKWTAPRDASRFGNICAQVTTLGVFAGPASVEEDCLYLNVFTTKLGNASAPASGGLPVIVWIHGGGNVDGTSGDYDGTRLATGGPLGVPTVVVTINYRLGLFGFLAHPALNAENHPFGNYGIMDVQAALRWVQRNAAVFGGDPAKVTLGGQSAGATDTGANMIAPSSAGLFHRAIFQSSPLNAMPPLSLGLSRGSDFGTAAGCGSGADAKTAACLRALSSSRILQLQGTANANGPYVTGPMVDGSIVPISPNTAWTTGKFNRMPIMAGNVQDEATFGIGNNEYFSGPPQAPINEAQYVANITAAYSGPVYPGGPNYPKGTAEAVLKQYPAGSDPQMALNLAGTQAGACRNRHIDALWSKWSDAPVYAYEFNDRHAPYYYPPMPGFAPLAAHTIDIQFLFPLWHGGILGTPGASQSKALTADEQRLSDQLVAAWTRFARSGNPNESGNAPWPRFVNQEGVAEYLSQNVPALSTFTNAQFGANHNCGFWDGIIVYQP